MRHTDNREDRTTGDRRFSDMELELLNLLRDAVGPLEALYEHANPRDTKTTPEKLGELLSIMDSHDYAGSAQDDMIAIAGEVSEDLQSYCDLGWNDPRNLTGKISKAVNARTNGNSSGTPGI